MSDRKPTRLIDFLDPAHAHEEAAKLYNTRESEVSVMHPLEILVSRELLIMTVENNLAAIRENQLLTDHDQRDRDYIDALIQQRIDYLDRLRSDHAETVFVALYPTGSEEPDPLGLDDDDLGPPHVDDLPL